jgi:hypothetical protein
VQGPLRRAAAAAAAAAASRAAAAPPPPRPARARPRRAPTAPRPTPRHAAPPAAQVTLIGAAGLGVLLKMRASATHSDHVKEHYVAGQGLLQISWFFTMAASLYRCVRVRVCPGGKGAGVDPGGRG